MPLSKVIIFSFVALITMVNPLAVIPSFIAITEGTLRKERARVALIAGIATTVMLTLFLLAGNYIFKFLGITIPAFQIMGGIIFFSNALRTLGEDEHRIRSFAAHQRARSPEKEETPQEELDPASVAVVPLAIPMLSGPGAITTTMVLVSSYPGWPQKLAIITAIVAVGAVSWLTLLAAVPISRFIGERGRTVFSKIMALLLGAIGIQFIINGIKPLIQEIVG